jgi:hypothetical protein
MVGAVEQDFVQAGKVLFFSNQQLFVFVKRHKCTQDAPSLFHRRVEPEGANGNKQFKSLAS